MQVTIQKPKTVSRPGGKWLRLKRRRTALVGLGIISFFAVTSALASLIAPYDPLLVALENRLVQPNAQFILGADPLGRDVLSRILYGGRFTLLIGFSAVAISAIVGVPIGVVSGFFGGKVDLVIQRFVDMMLAFPGILLALALVAVLGVGLENLIIAVGVSGIPVYTRLVRSTTLQVKNLAFIEAAKAMGLPIRVILFKHVLLNSLSPVIVQSTLQLGTAILAAGALGFLGLGVKPPTPEWGSMLADGRAYLLNAPHVTTFPGLMIFLTVLGFNMLGDGLRDALDPRLRVFGEA